MRLFALALVATALICAPALAQDAPPKDDKAPAAPACDNCRIAQPPAAKPAPAITSARAGQLVAVAKTAKDDKSAAALLLTRVPQLGPKGAAALATKLRASDSWKACLTLVVRSATSCRTIDKATREKLFPTKQARELAEILRDCEKMETAVLLATAQIKGLDDEKVAAAMITQVKSAKTLDAATELLQVTAARFGGAVDDGCGGGGCASSCKPAAAPTKATPAKPKQ